MATEQITENRLVITANGKAAGTWAWLNHGGWKKGLANPNVDRYRSDVKPSSQAVLDEAIADGLFAYEAVTEIRHYF
jgi:hypothetical protein